MADSMASFASFRGGMADKMNSLRRRFSQGELQGDDGLEQQQQNSATSSTNPSPNPSVTSSAGSQMQQPPNPSMYGSAMQRDRPNMSLNLSSTSPSGSQPGSGSTASATAPPGSSFQHNQQQMQYQRQQQQSQPQQQPLPKTTSAPSSPTKNYTPANIARSIFRQVSQSTTNLVQQTVAAAGSVTGGPREKAKILLVIDDQHTDWSKYFRGRRIQNEWEIRIEQAEFSEINMAASSDRGLAVDMDIMRGGTKVVRSFRPDFVLIRQPIRDATRDYRHFILALMYANIPSVNSLESLYMFLDKPIIFSQLIQIQQRLGKEKFPLIQQSFYPNHREMLTSTSFPVVIKIGHAHAGLGKTRVETQYDFQDIASLVGSCGAYCSVEPFVDSKYDLHLQKIGPSYKAFIRKSISGSWKANIGSSMLEQVPLQEKHRLWLDECARVFGGLDVFAIELLVGKDGQEHIIGINDSSAMGLLGETQEEDRQLIAEIVFRKMDSDANRRRYSVAQSTPVAPLENQRNPQQQYGPPGQQPSVPNGYPGGMQGRRESRDNTSSGPGAPLSGTMSNRGGPSPGGPPGAMPPRDPPLRDPRDSNFRDVSATREPPPGRETPSRDSGNVGSAGRRESDSRNSSFSSGSSGIGSGSTASGQTPLTGMGSAADRRPLPQPGMGMGMNGPMGARPGMPPPPGHIPGQGPAQVPPQPGAMGGANRQMSGTDTDDTMSNLKRTFAGIFGDM